MTDLTLDRARAIVEHAEKELGAGGRIPDAFASFARGGASTREEAINALFIVIADYYRVAYQHGAHSEVLQRFCNYAKASESIAMRLTFDAINNPEALLHVMSTDTQETVHSFVNYLCSLDPTDKDFFPRVYDRIGLTYPAELRIEPSSVPAPRTSKPWWRFW